jgi:hypothetical protein
VGDLIGVDSRGGNLGRLTDGFKLLFGLALGLTPPWFIDRVEFDPANKRLDLFLAFERAARFT